MEYTAKRSKKEIRAEFCKDIQEYCISVLSEVAFYVLAFAACFIVICVAVVIGYALEKLSILFSTLPKDTVRFVLVASLFFIAFIIFIYVTAIELISTYKVRIKCRILPLTEEELRASGVYASESVDRNMAEWLWTFLQITEIQKYGLYINERLKDELKTYIEEAASHLGFQWVGIYDSDLTLRSLSNEYFSYTDHQGKHFKLDLKTTAHDDFINFFAQIMSEARAIDVLSPAPAIK